MNGQVVPDEVSIVEFGALMWQGRLWVCGITFLFILVSAVWGWSISNVYRSQVLLVPSDDLSSKSSVSGSLSGIAGLAGISIGSQGVSGARLTIEVLRSRAFLFDFIDRHDICSQLLYVDGWNKSTNKLLVGGEELDARTVEGEGSLQLAYAELLERLVVNVDNESGFISISLENYSPFIAKEWLDSLVSEVNQEMKQRKINETKRRIGFLQQQLKKTAISEMRSVLFNLIEEQTRVLMMAMAREEFALKTIDPAIVPEKKHRPKRAVILLVGAGLGLVVSCLFVFGRSFSRRVVIE